MEFNREQIIKALECCTNCSCGTECPYYEYEPCQTALDKDVLSLIKELTEENESWQKSLITQKENADKAYYELACEVENLRAENERLREDNEIKSQKRANIFEIANAYERGKADTVRKMQERLKEAFNHYPQRCGECCKEKVDQISKKMLEGKNEK